MGTRATGVYRERAERRRRTQGTGETRGDGWQRTEEDEHLLRLVTRYSTLTLHQAAYACWGGRIEVARRRARLMVEAGLLHRCADVNASWPPGERLLHRLAVADAGVRLESEGHTCRAYASSGLALQELSDEAWQEVPALGDQLLQREAGGVFGSLPRVTWRQDGHWRRQMARGFDDLAGDCASTVTSNHAALARTWPCTSVSPRAQDLTRNRPRFMSEAVAPLPEDRRDFDWGACSDDLFQDHDVPRLFDNTLDGIEDLSNGIHQAMGMVHLIPSKWFARFDPDQGRDPDRGFRHP
ncbi:hypothetical protein [Streptomyces sp. NPDC002132]|uniref:hypothetical protein n=1 Tax=unclassified Streptomyces TaxID=2593676 RepID=UPI003330C5D8